MRIRIFTDGSCSENPGPGGWAAVFNTDTDCGTISGNESNTTNNRMELKAVVESFKKIFDIITGSDEYELYSDSAYVVNAINNNWIEKWQANGWRTTKYDEVKNKDLWEEFIGIRKELKDFKINVKIVKIKGHKGNTFNELVDRLAKEETQKAKNAEA